MFTTKHSASVMMLGVVALNGEKMPPVWFLYGYKLTATYYKDVLATKVLPWVRKITRNAEYNSEEDGGPAHNAKIVQEWLVFSTLFPFDLFLVVVAPSPRISGRSHPLTPQRGQSRFPLFG